MGFNRLLDDNKGFGAIYLIPVCAHQLIRAILGFIANQPVILGF